MYYTYYPDWTQSTTSATISSTTWTWGQKTSDELYNDLFGAWTREPSKKEPKKPTEADWESQEEIDKFLGEFTIKECDGS